MAFNTNLHNLLSALHRSDELQWAKLSGLSGQISGSFTADKVAVGSGTGLSASAYSISDTTTSGLFTEQNQNITLGTTIANADAVKNYVDGKVAELDAQQGTALTGVAITGAALTVGINDKRADFTLKTDDVTIGQDANGIKSLLTLVKLGSPDSAYAAQYQLQNVSGAAVGATINIPKDQFLSGVTYNATTEQLQFTFIVADGAGGSVAQTLDVSVADMVHEYQGSDAVDVTVDTAGSSTISLKLDGTTAGSEAGTGKFLSITSDGLLLSGVQDAINTKGDAISSYLWDSTSGEIYKALSGYTSGNAVSNKFQEIDTALANAGIGATYEANKVLVTDASGKIDDSAFAIGATNKDGFGAADELAVEAAVTGYVADQVSTAVSGVTASGQFVFGKGNGTVETTGKTLLTVADVNGASDDTVMANDNVIPTAAAVKAFVELGLADVYNAITGFNQNLQ